MQLEKYLLENGIRLTEPRRALIAVMPEKEKFRAEDLWELAKRSYPMLGRATVFRTLDLLCRLALLDRVEDEEGGRYYRACSPVHHHHISCLGCGRVDELTDLENLGFSRLAQTKGYVLRGHHVELYGLCQNCLTKEGVDHVELD